MRHPGFAGHLSYQVCIYHPNTRWEETFAIAAKLLTCFVKVILKIFVCENLEVSLDRLSNKILNAQI